MMIWLGSAVRLVGFARCSPSSTPLVVRSTRLVDIPLCHHWEEGQGLAAGQGRTRSAAESRTGPLTLRSGDASPSWSSPARPGLAWQPALGLPSEGLRDAGPADGDHHRVLLRLPEVANAGPPHGVVPLAGEDVALGGQVDAERPGDEDADRGACLVVGLAGSLVACWMDSPLDLDVVRHADIGRGS